jgi:competence protein ComFC
MNKGAIHLSFDKYSLGCYHMGVFGKLFGGLVDIIYPKTCVACKNKIGDKTAVDELICRQCWSGIKRNLPPFCHRCGRHLDVAETAKSICDPCYKKEFHFDRAFSPCIYEGIIKELIHEFKYKGKDYLGNSLARLMTEFIKEYNFPIGDMDLIIPVPLHKTKLREREFNQAGILAHRLADEFGKIFSEGILGRQRYTQAQAELTADSNRWENVKGSFALKKKNDIIGKNILLVDDVFTTGATVSEAAYTLKNSGAGAVFVITLAN